MSEHVLFLTGKLARPRLEKVLKGLEPLGFDYSIDDLGVKVAALVTGDLIRRRLSRPVTADKVIVPGRCRADLDALEAFYERPFMRGPDDLKDLPDYLGAGGGTPDLSRHDVRIFAEIVDAPTLTIDAILARAGHYRQAGADVIDLGCLPDTEFRHLEEAVDALHQAGHTVSVDSANIRELERGGRAGAEFLLSLSEDSLWLASEVDATPVLIPARHGDLDSLLRSMDALDRAGRAYLADPILDPIHFGFVESLQRYAILRKERPEAEILMGTGNLTELTDADTTGITTLLMGAVSELDIRNVLVVQVSAHCRRNVQETDAARRMMFAAKDAASLPVGFSHALLCLRGRKPMPNSPAEIAEMAELISDANFRVECADDGIHVYNREGHFVAKDPYQLFPELGVEEDGAHAFYMGAELAKAQIAWQLGKRYVQDEPLDWGVAVDSVDVDKTVFKETGQTLKRRRELKS